MAVSEQTPYIEYTANGTTTSFALEFDCDNPDHLIVLFDEVEPVVGTWSLSGGAVVFGTAPTSGKKIIILRNTPFSRNVDYQSYNNSFRPQSVNGDFDRLWLKLQELGVANWLMKQYVDKKDDELKAYLMEEIRKQGVALDQLDEYYDYLMERLAQIAVDKGWDASFVVDSSGKTQQELNNDVYSLTKTNAKKYTDFASSSDAAPYISALANAMPEGATLLIPSGNWAIKSNCTISKQINIKCDGEIVIDGSNPLAVFRMKRDPVYTLSGTDLVSLPKKGDTKLSFINSSLFDSSIHFVVLNSTEIETVRIGFADPYYKNETLDFIDSNFNLRGQIDLDYTDASKLTVKVYKKYKPVTVQLKASHNPAPGQTTGLKIIEVQGFDHVVWDVSIDRTTSKNIAGSSFSYLYNALFTFLPSCRISGGQSDYGDSYAFQNTCSSYILHYGSSYFDCGATSKKERGYVGRHGKYVLFEACTLNGIDDHYGHHYTIRNMNFLNRGIGISGGHVTIENCNQYSATEPLYFIRTDTPYCDGDLRIINCSARVLLALTSANNPAYSAKFKMFDRVILRDIIANIGNTNFMNIGIFYDHNINSISESFEIDNVIIKRNGTGRFISDSQLNFRFNKFTLNNYRIISDTSTTQMNTAILADVVTINDSMNIDGRVLGREVNVRNSKYGYLAASSNQLSATEKLIFNDVEFVNDGGTYSTLATLGQVYLYNCKVNTFRFFDVSDFQTKVVASIGTVSNIKNPINFDLWSYDKNKMDRMATANKEIGTLALGAVTSITTVAISGARLGDFVQASFVAVSPTGLRINAWVSSNNNVQFYVENPANNPAGSQTIAKADIRFTVRST